MSPRRPRTTYPPSICPPPVMMRDRSEGSFTRWGRVRGVGRVPARRVSAPPTRVRRFREALMELSRLVLGRLHPSMAIVDSTEEADLRTDLEDVAVLHGVP